MWLVETPIILTLLLFGSALLLGLWAKSLRMAGKVRYDYYYLHFTLASFVVLMALCFILGMVRPNEITIMDSFGGLSLRKIAWALFSGVAVGIGTSLMASAIPVAGMSASLIMGGGMALTVTLIWNAIGGLIPGGTGLYAGAAAGLISSITAAAAYSKWFAAQPKPAAKPVPPAYRSRPSLEPKAHALKGIASALIGGLLLGCVMPMHDQARESLIGLPVYTAVFFMAIGALVSVIVMAPFFLFFPLEGLPGRLKDYWKAPDGIRQRGWAGGTIWALGTLALFLGLGPRNEANPALSGLNFFLAYAGPLVGSLAGMGLWGELKGSPSRLLGMAATVLFALAVAAAAWIR